MSTILWMAGLGGLVSLISTSVGAVLTPKLARSTRMGDFRSSVDFALGVMLSAVAFSLVGPNLVDAMANLDRLLLVGSGFVLGVGFLLIGHAFVARSAAAHAGPGSASRWMFAAAIILHNFPEGMGAGTSMAGTKLSEALVLQIGLSIQNVAEGALLVVCLSALGWSMRWAVIGSVFSGLVEFSGALIGGFALDWTLSSLPFSLALAGGAMLASVILEHRERLKEGKPVAIMKLLAGLCSIPIINFILPV